MSEPKQGILRTPDGATIATLTLGRGPRRLVYLPGAGDGLATPLDAPGRLAMWLRGRGTHFRVLYISRRDPLPAGFSLADQAADVIWTMERLGWDGSLIEAQSAGGPVGQLVAAMRPDLAPVLVLASSAGWLDAQAQLACERWLELARRGDWGAFMTQATELLWRDANMALLRPFRRLLSELAAPRDPLRVVHLLESLLTLDHRALLPSIQSPTLISGGADDTLFGASLQTQMAQAIPGSRLILSPGYGHGHDLENPAHMERVAAFARLHGARLRAPALAAG